MLVDARIGIRAALEVRNPPLPCWLNKTSPPQSDLAYSVPF